MTGSAQSAAHAIVFLALETSDASFHLTKYKNTLRKHFPPYRYNKHFIRMKNIREH